MTTRSRPLLNQFIFAAQIGLNMVVGYLFLKVLAVEFGTTSDKDAFDIAYSVPYLLMAASGFTFLHGIITSHFAKLLASDSANVEGVFSSALNAACCVGAGLVLLCITFSQQTAEWLAPGLPPTKRLEISRLILLMSPLVFTLGISTYLSAVLT